ncbi:MAG: NAD-dependent epimerase/dehydratase family protein [Anaerolineae bacterium]|nr:NAD-dependent epimerase/dehydratase family protein [Anaerolineae bacterium]
MKQVKERRILITGGSGFIGYHLSNYLSQEPTNQVVLVDNFIRGKRDEDLEALLARPNVQLVTGDLTDLATFAQLGDGYDEVYHLAAIIGVKNVIERPHEVVRVNAIATLFLLDWFVKGGGKKILFSSTSESYAWTQQFYQLPIPTPENVPVALTDIKNPRSSYAGSKIFGELAVTQYCQMYGKPFVNVRFHNVYGPRMGFEHVIPELYQRALNGQNPLVVYSANYSRAFCYVQDAVMAITKAMQNPAGDGHTFNVGNDEEEITIGELAQRILEKANVSIDIAPQVAAHDPIVRRCPDISQARKLLDYQPQVSLDEGLEQTLAWYARRLAEPVA